MDDMPKSYQFQQQFSFYIFTLHLLSIQMRCNKQTEQKCSQVKQHLRKYLSDMFESMLSSFSIALQKQFQRIKRLYDRCIEERNHLEAEVSIIQNMKKSISHMFSLVDQIEKQPRFSLAANNSLCKANNEYYALQNRSARGREQDSNPLSDRSNANSFNYTPSTSARRFQRKNNSSGLFKVQAFALIQKQNNGIAANQKIGSKNTQQHYRRPTAKFLY